MRQRTGYLIRRGKVFHAVWTVAGKKFMQSTGKRNRKEAEKELRRIMEPLAIGADVTLLQNIAARIESRSTDLERVQDERNPPPTVFAAWTEYLHSPTATGKKRPAGHRPDSSPATLGQYESQYDAFARWAEGRSEIKTLADVTPDLAREYAAHLEQNVGAATFNKHIGLLELVWTVLAKQARITMNPWAEVGRKHAAAQSRRELTIDELRTVCRSAQGEMRVLFALGIYTGLRMGDAATLRWNEVDLHRKIIRRIPMKTARRNPRPVMIPIHAALGAMLGEMPEAERGEYILPDTAAVYLRDSGALSRRIQDFIESCGVKTHRPGTGRGTGERAVVDVGFHSLRHSFVSMCREGNAPLAVVEAIVGHSSPAMTRHYTHVSELAAANAVNALPSVLGDDTPPALPSSGPPPRGESEEAEIRRIVASMTARTWKADRARLLHLLNETPPIG